MQALKGGPPGSPVSDSPPLGALALCAPPHWTLQWPAAGKRGACNMCAPVAECEDCDTPRLEHAVHLGKHRLWLLHVLDAAIQVGEVSERCRCCKPVPPAHGGEKRGGPGEGVGRSRNSAVPPAVGFTARAAQASLAGRHSVRSAAQGSVHGRAHAMQRAAHTPDAAHDGVDARVAQRPAAGFTVQVPGARSRGAGSDERRADDQPPIPPPLTAQFHPTPRRKSAAPRPHRTK